MKLKYRLNISDKNYPHFYGTCILMLWRMIMQGREMRGERYWSMVNNLYTSINIYSYSPPGSSVHGILQARMLEWVAIPFPTQGWNQGLLHCRQIRYRLSHQGSPRWFMVLEYALQIIFLVIIKEHHYVITFCYLLQETFYLLYLSYCFSKQSFMVDKIPIS